MATAPPIAHVRRTWRSEDVKTDKKLTFLLFVGDNRILAGLKEAGFQNPSPVQVRALPEACLGKDLIVQSKSGTGKTCFFAIRALDCLSTSSEELQVLILAPTREIASQTQKVVSTIGIQFENLTCAMFIGGIPMAQDINKVQGCQIAVGTPGRISELIYKEYLQTSAVKLLILDEADKLMKLPFSADVNYIIDNLPTRRQTLAVSATFMDALSDPSLNDLLNRYMRNPKVIYVYEDDIALKGVLQFFHVVNVSEDTYGKKFEILLKVLNGTSFSQCMVFSNSVADVLKLCADLKRNGHAVASISSQDDQNTRLQTLELLKEAKIKVLVTSDLTARGIDAANVNLVVQMDHSWNFTTYLHRVGRAGRYGGRGVSVVIVSSGRPAYKLLLYRLEGGLTLYPLPDPIPYYLKKYEPASPELENEILKYDTSQKYRMNSRNVRSRKENKIFTANKIRETGNGKDFQDITDKGDSITTPKEIINSAVVSSVAFSVSSVASSVSSFNQEDETCSEDSEMEDKESVQNGNLPISSVMGKSNVSPKITLCEKAIGDIKCIKDFNPKEAPQKESHLKSHEKSPKGAIEESDFIVMEQRSKFCILKSSSKSRHDHRDNARLSHHHRHSPRLLDHHHRHSPRLLDHHHRHSPRLLDHHHRDRAGLSHRGRAGLSHRGRAGLSHRGRAGLSRHQHSAGFSHQYSAMSCHYQCSAMSCHCHQCSAMSCHCHQCSAMSCHCHQCSAMSCHCHQSSAMSCHCHPRSAMSCHCHQWCAMSCHCNQDNAQSHCDCICSHCEHQKGFGSYYSINQGEVCHACNSYQDTNSEFCDFIPPPPPLFPY